ncbi:MAG: acyltransferase [Cyanobacteria bacterium J069]|nr:MAG: acyltransferase [Cyanobacteria bacterium J069]
MSNPGISALDRASAPPAKLNAQTQRISFIDYAKGIGIFLVVLGHALRGLVGTVFEPNALTQMLDQWIYAFHMPLFFFLSGFFIERSVSQPFGSVVANKLKTIIYPYLVWSVLQETLRHVAGISDQPLTELWRILYAPILQFWFLYVLFVVSLAYVMLRKLGASVMVCFGLAALLFASELVDLDLGPWLVLYAIRLNAVYFMLGAVARTFNWLDLISKAEPSALLLRAFFGFSLIALAAVLNLALVEYWLFPLALVGISATLSLARYLETRDRFSSLQTWGLLSLEIFVAHTIFAAAVRIFLQKGLGVSNPIVHVVLGTIAGIYGSLLLYRFCAKVNVPYLFRLKSATASSR